MAFDPDGALCFSDGGNQRIRRITSGGLVETVAGHGVNPPDYSPVSTACMGSWATAESCRVAQGDGGPALEATLWWPLRLLISQDGDLFVAMTSAITSGVWEAGHFSQLRRICRIDRYHPNSPTAVEEEVPRIRQPVSVGDEPFLLQVYPNPVNPSTQIRFAFPEQTVVWAEVWDVLGRPVRRLVEGEVFAAGEHRLRWEGRDGSGGRVGSGVYVVRVRAGERAQAVKVVVVR